MQTDAKLRILIAEDAKQGFMAPEVATCTGFSRRAVQDWVARYNQEGLNGLETRPGRGRKGPPTAEEAERFRRRIEAGALPEDGVCVLRGIEEREADDNSDGGVIPLERFGGKELQPVVEFRQCRVLRREVHGRPQSAMLGACAKPLSQRVLFREEHHRACVSRFRSYVGITG